MQLYSEKRNSPRTPVAFSARYRVDGEKQYYNAIIWDHSGGGLLLEVQRRLEPGSRLVVDRKPETTVTSPLCAVLEVVRCEPGTEKNSFYLACVINEKLPEDEIPPDFP